MTLTKTKTLVKIIRSDWEKMKKNPVLSETLELMEDISDLEKAKKSVVKVCQLTNTWRSVAYKILIKPSVIKDPDILPDVEVQRILSRINQLKDNPHPIGIQK